MFQKYHVIEPGTDILKLDTHRPRLKIPWLWIGCLAFAAMVIFLLYGKNRAVEAYPGPLGATPTATLDNGDNTRTPTPAGTLASPTPTPTATGYLAMLGMPNVETGTRAPNESVSCEGSTTTIRVEVTRVVQAPAPSCKAVTTTINTEVTRVVQVQVTRVVEHMITAVVTSVVYGSTWTPVPSSTPWVIVVEVTREATREVEVTRLVEVTSTPTPTATATPLPPTPTLEETAPVLQETPYPSPVEGAD